MAKKDYYLIEKNVNKITRNEPTGFLDPATYQKVISKLKGQAYNTYYPYKDSDKVIIYTTAIPNVNLLEIISYDKLTHREILGSLFGLNIDASLFGDIIITNNHYYIMVVNSILTLIQNELTMIGNHHIKLKEVPFTILDDYHRQYEEISFIVSSTRIDNVIAHLIGTSRDEIKKKFLNDEVILNYNVCHKPTYQLFENDIFSIRKYGKYKYLGIIKNTKKDHYLIKINKYIDN